MVDNRKDVQEAGEAAAEGADAAEQAPADTGGQASGNDSGKDGGKADDDARVDAIVKKRLARERAKMEREIRKQVEDEAKGMQSEADKLKNMTELQRAQYEAEKERKEKEALQRRIDLSEQTAIARRELESADIRLGDDLLAMFVSESAEETGKAIEQLKELWPKAVNEAVQQQLKRTPPKAEKPQAGKSYGAEFAEKYSKAKIGKEGK